MVLNRNGHHVLYSNFSRIAVREGRMANFFYCCTFFLWLLCILGKNRFQSKEQPTSDHNPTEEMSWRITDRLASHFFAVALFNYRKTLPIFVWGLHHLSVCRNTARIFIIRAIIQTESCNFIMEPKD